jgi:hypothetical protein
MRTDKIMTNHRRSLRERFTSEAGTTLIETAIACGILLVTMGGLMGLTTLTTNTTENQGHLGARTTEYAQDKMEQLLSLKYGDVQSDTRTFPATANGGTGLAVGGSSDPAAPVALYVDYLRQDGTLLASNGVQAPAGWFYQRVWAVTSPSANLKQITVTTIVATGVGGATRPQSTMSALKTSPF